MLKQIHKDLIEQVEKNGIAKCHVSDILHQKDRDKFNNIIDFYNDFLSSPHIADRCNKIFNGNPIQDKHKWYEITQYEYLNRGLNLKDGDFIKFFLSETFIEMARLYFNNDVKLRNTLTWVHPQNAFQREFSSQEWHRDPEDLKILKIFVNFNDIDQDQGPTQYVKETQYGGKHQNITFNLNGGDKIKIGPGWPLQYPIPSENVTDVSGPVGTVCFVNTHGLHKGGLVKEGVRCLGQGLYLSKNAYAFSPSAHEDHNLKSFNNNPNLNFIDFESKEFKSLNDKQKFALNEMF